MTIQLVFSVSNFVWDNLNKTFFDYFQKNKKSKTLNFRPHFSGCRDPSRLSHILEKFPFFGLGNTSEVFGLNFLVEESEKFKHWVLLALRLSWRPVAVTQ